jgi:hypothetical protein
MTHERFLVLGFTEATRWQPIIIAHHELQADAHGG